MSDASPTRSVVLEMKDERRAMHEGWVFLDEKCLLLAGEILRELERYAQMQRAFLASYAGALAKLQAAVARHGLQELQVHPAADLSTAALERNARALMGVRLQDARLRISPAAEPVAPNRSPESQACRQAFAALLEEAAGVAAVAGNLERLYQEYRRSVRRARALQDVLLPELAHSIYDIETRLEELEQEDAIWMRQGVG